MKNDSQISYDFYMLPKYLQSSNKKKEIFNVNNKKISNKRKKNNCI